MQVRTIIGRMVGSPTPSGRTGSKSAAKPGADPRPSEPAIDRARPPTSGGHLLPRSLWALLFLFAAMGWTAEALATTTINKQFTPNTINAGDTTKFRITILNTSLVALTAAAVTDNLPAAIKIAPTPNITDTCGFTSVTATAGTSVVKLTGGTIPAHVGVDGQCYVEVDVTATTAGNATNTIPANGPTNGFTPGGAVAGYQATENTVTVTNTTSASATLSVVASTLSPPTGAKTFAPTAGLLGQPVTLTIVLTNPLGNGTATMPLTTFTDTLPTGMVVAPTPAASIDCTTQGTGGVNGTLTATAGANSLTLTGGAIGGTSGGLAGICTLSVNVVVNSITGTTKNFTNSLAAGAIGNARGLASVAFSKAITIATPIGLTKSFLTGTVSPNQDALLQLDITNGTATDNPAPLTVTSLADTLPSGLTVGDVTTTPPTIDCATGGGSGGTFSPALTQGATAITIVNAVVGNTAGIARLCRITVPVRAAAVGSYANSIAANKVINPGNFTSPAASATLTVSSPIGLAKSFLTGTVGPNEDSVLQLDITNGSSTTNPAPLTVTSLTDTLPSGLTVGNVTATPPTIDCTTGGGSGGSFSPALAQGATAITIVNAVVGNATGIARQCRIKVPVRTAAVGSYLNSIPANSVLNTANFTSPAASATLTVSSPIGLTKSFLATTVSPNQDSILQLDITNGSSTTNPAPLTVTSLTDTLPSGLTVGNVTTTPPTISCTTGGGSGGSFSPAPTQGATAITIVNAVVGNTAGITRRCRITVPVRAAAVGSYLNSITANSVVNPTNFTSPAASATLTVSTPIGLTKSFLTATVSPNADSILRIDITNGTTTTNPALLTVTSLTDTLPSGLTVGNVTATPPTIACNNGGSGGTFSPALTQGATAITIVNAVVGNAAGKARRCRIQVPVRSAASGSYLNSIPANSVLNPGNFTSPAASATLKVNGDATITKTFAPTSIVQGDTSLVTLTIGNAAGVSLTNAFLTDPLPSSIVVAPAPTVSNTCGGTVTALPGSGSVSLAGASIPTTGCALQFRVTGYTTGATYTNTIAANTLTTNEGVTNPTAASATLAVTAGLNGTKSFSPSSVANGGVARVTLTLSNTSTSAPYTGVGVSDGPMTNLKIATPASASTTCAGPTVITATPGATTATLAGATIPAGGNCIFQFNVVTSGNPTNWPNTVAAGKITSTQGASNTASFTATLGKTSGSVGIGKAFDLPSVTGGQPAVLKIDVINGSVPVTNTALTDTFPTGMRVYSVPNAHTTCPNGTVSATPDGGSVTLSGATLAASQICQVYVTVTSIKFLNLTNTIPVSAITTAEALTNSVTASATLTTLEGLGVAKGFTPTSIAPGQSARLKISLISTYNALATIPKTLTGVSVTDNLPSGMVVATAPNATTDCTGGSVTAAAGATQVTVSGATIAPETNCSMQVDVTASALGTYTNTIPKSTATSTQGVSNDANDAVASLNVVNAPVISKAFSPAAVTAGVTSTLTVTLANSNAQALTGAALTDNLPAGLTVASPPNAATTCAGTGVAVAAAAGGTSIALTNATIPAGGSCTFQADVASNTPAVYANSIPSGALATIEGASNTAAANANLTVLQPPTVGKSFSPSSINVNGTTQLTITLGNGNADPITLSAALTDTLPGTLKVANPNGLAKTCPGTVTATANSNTITYANGAAIPAGGCTIQVNVTGAQGGSNLNVIAVGALQTSSGNNQAAASATLDLQAVAIGNRVWLDNGAGGGTANNGIQDGTEAGIGGVAVTLYTSGNVLTSTTTTDPGGDYYFDNLTPGDYYVKITASEFTNGKPLFGLRSSTGADGTQTVDLNDNGIDNATPASNGIQTNTFALAAGTMPTGENQTGYPGSLPDNSVNATDDLGFVALVDLAVTKTNSGSGISPGDSTSYIIVVTNQGPAEVTAASVTDTAPAKLTFGAWTCAVSAAGNSGSVATACGADVGSGDLATTVNLAVGGSVTFILAATIAADAVGSLTNTATVAAPGGIVDPNQSNNSAAATIDVTSPSTPVTLSYFKASAGRVKGDVSFEWQTATEVGHLGFKLYVADGLGGWLLVTDNLIPSDPGDSNEVRYYRYNAVGLQGQWFMITDLDILGAETWHGPFRLGVGHGVENPQGERIDWQGIKQEHDREQDLRRQQDRGRMKRQLEEKKMKLKRENHSGGLDHHSGHAQV